MMAAKGIHTMKHRCAFTLIELLVVIAVIVILLGLALPAAQRVRDTASCLRCKNHLRQIGTALYSYHDRQSSFPPGYVSQTQADGLERGPGWGWAASLLDDLDQGPLYQHIQFDKAITDPVQAAARVKSLPVLVCPADMQGGDAFRVVDKTGRDLVEVGRASYTAMNGVLGVSHHAEDNNGAFLRNRSLRLADITDGVRHTLFIGERSSNQSLVTWTGVVPGGVVTPLGNGLRGEHGVGPDLAPALVLSHGSRSLLPNDPDVVDADVVRSRHGLGVNFLFGDGSARTLGRHIDGPVYEALLTRAGKEPVAGDDY
jgi:prepilin-type N-terminal cleavage/methylation domain-containing protein/prepilin-type processing-associated H-X9-DG protein